MPVYHCYNWSTMVWEQQERIKPITGGSKAGQDERERVSGGLHPPFVEEGEERGDAVFGGDQTRDLRSATPQRGGGSWSAGALPSLLSLSPGCRRQPQALPCQQRRSQDEVLLKLPAKTTLALSSPRAEWGGDVFKVIINAFQAADFRESRVPLKVDIWHSGSTAAHLWENGRLRQELWGGFSFGAPLVSNPRC